MRFALRFVLATLIVPAIEPQTFGRAAAEALAMGRPVVASAVGALPEIVLAPPHVPADERTGWLWNRNTTAISPSKALRTSWPAGDVEFWSLKRQATITDELPVTAT